MKSTLLTLLLLVVAFNVSLAQEEITVSKDPGNDQTPSLTPIHLTNRGLNGSPYRWTFYTAAIGGGYGVMPNAFEIWEYPAASMNSNWSIQRFSINKSNGHPPAVMIDQNGGLALGGYIDAGNALLAVNGRMGIGTRDTKGYHLAVQGKIHTQEVNVDIDNWADYVFKPEYNLLPLTELKIFIDKNQHLPEVPSSDEVVNHGVNLGEMNKLLLKKIEELTLHLIEKDRQLKIQETLNQSSELRFKKLERQVELLLKKVNYSPLMP